MGARHVAFGPGYRRAQDRLGIVAGSPLARDLARLVSRMLVEDLPSPADTVTSIPPVLSRVYARRVERRNVWLYFDLDRRPNELRLITLTRRPPSPRD